MPIERASWCRFLFINGEDDRCLHWQHGRNLHERFANSPGNSRHVLYPNAGHFIDLPYSPLVAARWLPPLHATYAFGGKLEHHAHAQEKAWQEILTFLAKELN